MKLPFISRVVIKNYKSIVNCDVRLGPLQFLVGRNGAGKSNFLDALAFVRDALEHNLEQALGGLFPGRFRKSFRISSRRQMRHLAGSGQGDDSQHLGIALDFNLPSGVTGEYAFELQFAKNFSVKRERALVMKNGKKIASYETKNGKLQGGEDPKRFPPIANDRLYLQSMATFDQYRPLLDALRTIEIYQLNPERISRMSMLELESPLQSDGGNIASCLAVLDKATKARILEYLQVIAPFVHGFNTDGIHRHVLVRFAQKIKGQKDLYWLNAANMSDGTLRALGILVALMQKQKGDSNSPPLLVGIEEPETALHPRATASLLGALQEASEKRQVIVTTHGVDLLDNEDIPPDAILPVMRHNSETVIQPMKDVTADMMRKHLATAGELLRQDQLGFSLFDEQD